MTKPNFQLNQQIDEMRRRLTENAHNEQALLRALSDALGEVDEQLLSEVRQVTAEHEARRIGILSELQVLATRLCVFPKALANDQTGAHEQVTAHPLRNGKSRHAPGDWRQAASNIDDELDFYLDARPPGN